MKKLIILLLFSFPLVAEEKIELICEGDRVINFMELHSGDFFGNFLSTG